MMIIESLRIFLLLKAAPAPLFAKLLVDPWLPYSVCKYALSVPPVLLYSTCGPRAYRNAHLPTERRKLSAYRSPYPDLDVSFVSIIVGVRVTGESIGIEAVLNKRIRPAMTSSRITHVISKASHPSYEMPICLLKVGNSL